MQRGWQNGGWIGWTYKVKLSISSKLHHPLPHTTTSTSILPCNLGKRGVFILCTFSFLTSWFIKCLTKVLLARKGLCFCYCILSLYVLGWCCLETSFFKKISIDFEKYNKRAEQAQTTKAQQSLETCLSFPCWNAQYVMSATRGPSIKTQKSKHIIWWRKAVWHHGVCLFHCLTATTADENLSNGSGWNVYGQGYKLKFYSRYV